MSDLSKYSTYMYLHAFTWMTFKPPLDLISSASQNCWYKHHKQSTYWNAQPWNTIIRHNTRHYMWVFQHATTFLLSWQTLKSTGEIKFSGLLNSFIGRACDVENYQTEMFSATFWPKSPRKQTALFRALLCIRWHFQYWEQNRCACKRTALLFQCHCPKISIPPYHWIMQFSSSKRKHNPKSYCTTHAPKILKFELPQCSHCPNKNIILLFLAYHGNP